MAVERILFASVERVVWWGTVVWDAPRRVNRGSILLAFPVMMYIRVGAGKRNSGIGGARGALTIV